METPTDTERAQQIGATVFAVVAGLLFLLFLWRCGGAGDAPAPAAPDLILAPAAAPTTALASNAASPREEALRGQLADLTTDRDALTGRLARLQRDHAASADATEEAQAALARTRGQLADLEAEHRALAGRLAASETTRTEAAATLAATAAERDTANATAARLAGEKASLAEAAKRTQELESALAAAQAERDAALEAARRAEADRAVAEAAVASRPAGTLPVAAPKPLFVASADELGEDARALFGTLKEIHGGGGKLGRTPINAAYTAVTKGHRADLMLRVAFGTGESAIAPATAKQIGSLVRGAPDGSHFLVVGYADTTGSATTNRRVAESRARSVAASVTGAGGETPPPALEAAYLGATSRFDPDDLAKNRVVEVWRFGGEDG